MKIETVGVVGCGLMGSGIAQVTASAGFATRVFEARPEALEKGFAAIGSSLGKLASKGKLEPGDPERIMGRLRQADSLRGLASCDLVIEAATENFEIKKAVFSELDSVCKPETVLASNTSSISITSLMMTTARPDRFLGLHFFNPAPLMPLVEVARTLATGEEALSASLEFVAALGKEAVVCRDSAGFIVNRLLVPYLLDAVRALEEGVGDVRDIDRAMRLGCGYPMGPFTLLDLVGLDTICSVANILYEEFREKRFAPPPLLRRMVEAGRLGRKSGGGFMQMAEAFGGAAPGAGAR